MLQKCFRNTDVPQVREELMEGMRHIFSEFFSTVGVVDSIRVTLVMSFWSTLIASVLGITLGFMLEKKHFPGKRAVIRLNRTLMGAPPVVIGLLTYMLLRKKGPLGSLRWVFTIRGMVMAQVLIITPIVCGMVYSYAVQRAPAIRAFAKTMGADKRQTGRLLLREMKNELYFAVVSGYGRSISEVGAVFLVGGNIKNGAAGKLVRAALPPRKPKVLALLALLRQTSLGSVVRLALAPASPISHKQYF